MGVLCQGEENGPGSVLVMQLCLRLTERHQVLKEKANNLKLRPEGFQTILEGIGFVLDQSTGPVGEGGPRIFSAYSSR